MSRADKLPALKSTVTKRDVHMTSTRSNPDLALPATTPNLTPNGHATNHGDGAVVPRLNFNPFTSRESKTTIMHHESKKASADHGKTADQKRTHKANPKAGKKVAYPSDSGRIHTATGTSLADLRDEHKAALELLQELGGAYPDDAKPSSSRFGSKLRSTVLGGRDSNNDHTTTAYVDAALKAADVALNNRVVEIDDEVPEAESPGKEVSTADSNSARTSRRSEPSYDSEDFETD
ncbi:hypothetical protein AaE_001806 [Aphanomyces astaci]|uniref:Uncharacterized protein n=1 Tax=Aphanomyces astaci TaxID=112090 RepID=A0A6A5AVQ2_APHAT|nr:hypothetical protein AaE_001806 [Aphanomyces astaci]